MASGEREAAEVKRDGLRMREGGRATSFVEMMPEERRQQSDSTASDSDAVGKHW